METNADDRVELVPDFDDDCGFNFVDVVDDARLDSNTSNISHLNFKKLKISSVVGNSSSVMVDSHSRLVVSSKLLAKMVTINMSHLLTG